MSNATLSLVESAIQGLPKCGFTCLTALPEWTTPLTMDALNAVCGNIQNDINTFAKCITTGCTDPRDVLTCKTVIGLVPSGCQTLGFNTTGVALPTNLIPTGMVVATSSLAPTTSKSDADQIQSFGILASAVALATLMF
ncbi:hypothetical protein HDU98_000902 [Podochytrium sp. JEL0797]|nr:hypothetical protein HDU98_000902 [Podochytrium sp. JEL0797]